MLARPCQGLGRLPRPFAPPKTRWQRAVGSRKLSWTLAETVGVGLMPLVRRLKWRLVAECFLRDEPNICVGVCRKDLFEFRRGWESGGFQDVGDPPVEAFDHPVRAGGVGLDEAVLDAVPFAGLVEGVFAGGRALAAATEAVGEFLAVVGEHLDDPERTGRDEPLEEASGRLGLLVTENLDVDPARGPVDGGVDSGPGLHENTAD